eukprot:TRINITY_DN1212_c0_g1_i2.p1 TRINITY_DN1212_c0_g1~~TRINITY_DN1212_c0_g1_i2.p1  ORF type:complete len:108 (-),score=14.41 TRINITY_DN1212_c0_g1_i2:31-354(-)
MTLRWSFQVLLALLLTGNFSAPFWHIIRCTDCIFNYSYVYKKKDGRTSNPLVFIFFCPRGTPNNLNMLYASSKTQVVNALQIGKVFEIRDAETLTEDWLKEKLDFFK